MDRAVEPRDRPLLNRSLAAALLLAPAGFLLFFLFAWPEFSMFSASFRAPAWSFSNYSHFLGDPYYVGVLLRSLLLGVLVTAVTLSLGLPMAYWLARISQRWAPLLLVLATFPLWISAVVRSFGWVVLFSRNGALSQMLQAVGVVGPAFRLIGTLAGVVIALAQVLLPFMVLSLYGVMRAIDPEIERAAQNLGASPLKAVVLTVLPLAARGIVSASLLIFALAVSAFATPSLVGGARVQLMATTIYEQMTELADWPFAATVAFILLAVVLVIVLAATRLDAAGSAPGR